MRGFDDCLAFVLGEEGGYVNDPRDPGGETKYGISKRRYPNLDIAALTREAAGDIYRRDYWTPCHGDELPPPLALCVFDFATNAGCERAIVTMQHALKVDADGIIGPRTLAAARTSGALEIAAFHMLRETHYRGLSGFSRYGRGWLGRNDRCAARARAWLAEGAAP